MSEEGHQRFTVSDTAYMRNLSREQLSGKWTAILHQSPPKRTDRGTSFGLRFPVLIVADYVEQGEELAQQVASILNEHWPQEKPHVER